jgi:hypothetical protein
VIINDRPSGELSTPAGCALKTPALFTANPAAGCVSKAHRQAFIEQLPLMIVDHDDVVHLLRHGFPVGSWVEKCAALARVARARQTLPAEARSYCPAGWVGAREVRGRKQV